MPRCKCGRVMHWEQYKTWHGEPLYRRYYCPRCKRPSNDCTCTDSILKQAERRRRQCVLILQVNQRKDGE